MSILLEIFNELGQPPRRDYYFLATGGLRKNLARAEAACKAQWAILNEVQARFGASRVSIANNVEKRHWDNMGDAARFKLYFAKGEQPKDWHIPKSWGDRQSYWNSYVHMPPARSADQVYLRDAAERMAAAIEEAFPAEDGVRSAQERAENYGWFSWNDEVSKLYETPGVYAKSLGGGQFVLETNSRQVNYEPPEAMRNCKPLSKAHAQILIKEPERVARVLEGRNPRTLAERVGGVFRIGQNFSL